MRLVHFVAAAAAFAPAVASAGETVTYSYDAKGRLTQVAHAGSVNSGVTATYQFDSADNRTAVNITGSSYNAPARAVIVVPLRGLSILTLSDVAD